MKHTAFSHTRTVALLLAVLMLLGMMGLTACAEQTPDTPQEPGSTPEDSTPPDAPSEDPNAPDTDELPQGLNYNDYEFRIVSRERTFFHFNWVTDDFDGSYINDAIYSRQCEVEQRLGIHFSELPVQSTEAVRVAIVSGADECDMLNARCSDGWNYAAEGIVLPVSELEYIDLTKNYWDAVLNSAMTVGGVTYFATGASNITAYDLTHALLFNKGMIADYDLDSPYALVDRGEWTIEAFATMSETVTSDIDGNEDESVYGYLSQPKQVLPGFWIGAGMLSIEKDEEDIPAFTLPANVEFVELFELVYEITYDSGAWYVNQSRDNADPELLEMFQSDRGLFYATAFFYVENMRAMESDFGILPYPMYDEYQKEYCSRIEGCELSCVPITVVDKARTSAVLEAMAASSARTVEPAYYDIVLKGVSSRDEESSAMLDIIFANRIFDLGDTVFCDMLRDGVFETMFMSNDRNLASRLASVTSQLNSAIAESVEKFVGKQ